MRRPKKKPRTGESEPDRLEDILATADKKFPFLIESALDVMSLLDSDGTVRYLSPASERFLGYEPDELIGTNVLGIIHPDDVQAVLDTFARMMRQPGVTEYVHYRIKHKDGSWRWAESIGNNLIHQPFISCIVINSRDINERKLAEDALKDSEEYYRALIEHSMDAIFIIDEQARFKYSNLALERELGYRTEDLIGRSSLDFLHPDDVAMSAEVIAKAVRDPDYSPRIEVRIQHVDGDYFYFEGVGKSYLDNPSVAGIVIALRDITERKRAEEELRKYRENLEEMVEERTRELMEANRRLLSEVDERKQAEEALRVANQELEAFAFTLSHDLRSPLALARGFAKVAVSAVEEGKKKLEKDCLENILDAVERTDNYIFSLYQYARAGIPEGKAALVELDTALEEILTYLEEEIRRSGVELNVDEGLPAVHVDPLKLRQVLSNLVENAVRYMGDEPHPEVGIGASEEGDTVTVFVWDNGMGIPQAKQEAIFEPFKRLKEGGSDGLGIGLSTVKRAAEAWGGRVWVESSKGEGSTFYFTAPASRQA
jgi:PAS domain S-box-containing protein